jgi:Flp pilus assembly protein TadD
LPPALERFGLLWLPAAVLADAENYLTQAVALEPSCWMAWNVPGAIADLLSRFDEARENFERALAILPGRPKVLAGLGWSRLLTDDLEETERLLRSAVELAPDSATTQSNLAFCIALQGRYEEAIALYEVWDDRSVAANSVGYAARLRNDHSAARKYLSMVLELQPNYYRKAANDLAGIDP